MLAAGSRFSLPVVIRLTREIKTVLRWLNRHPLESDIRKTTGEQLQTRRRKLEDCCDRQSYAACSRKCRISRLLLGTRRASVVVAAVGARVRATLQRTASDRKSHGPPPTTTTMQTTPGVLYRQTRTRRQRSPKPETKTVSGRRRRRPEVTRWRAMTLWRVTAQLADSVAAADMTSFLWSRHSLGVRSHAHAPAQLTVTPRPLCFSRRLSVRPALNWSISVVRKAANEQGADSCECSDATIAWGRRTKATPW